MKQPPLTAALGKFGAPDANGFTGGGLADTRQITITDAAGSVIYSKRTSDTEKATDSHIAAVGYRRVGGWVNGLATVEPIPAKVKAKKRLKIAAAILVPIALIWTFVANSYAAAPNAAKESCIAKIETFLPPGQTAKFKDVSAKNDTRTQLDGSRLWDVRGKANTEDLSGEVRDIDFSCDVYMRGENVQKTVASMKR